MLWGRLGYRLMNSLIINYSVCVAGRVVVKGDYKVQDKSFSSMQTLGVSAVMHKALPLWSGLMLNVLSFKGSEKLNTFHQEAVAKPFLAFPSVCSKRCSV